MGWWGDVRALHTGDVAVGQVVVQQNEVGFGPVHRQFIVVVEGHIGQEQRPRNAVNGLQSIEVGRADGALVPCRFNHGLDGGDVFDVALVASVAFRVDVNPRAVGVGTADVVVEQFRKFGEVFRRDVVETCGEVIGVNHADFPASIADVNAPVNGNGDFTALRFHPVRDFVAHRFQAFGLCSQVHGEITSAIRLSMEWDVRRWPSSRR